MFLGKGICRVIKDVVAVSTHGSKSRLKHTVSLPPLPPEVWICIFHYATDVPGTLTPDIYTHTSLIGHIYNKKRLDLQRSLITKRALVRVCKQWWHLAMPFLYQSVYIDQESYLPLLSRTLADSATGKGAVVNTRPLGEYIQRLDVTIHSACEAQSGCLTTITKHMPHLAIVVFIPLDFYSDSTAMADNIVDALHHSALSLRVLDWSTPRLRPSNGRLLALLAKCTQLRVLHIPYPIWSEVLGYGGIPATVSTLLFQEILRSPGRPDLVAAHRSSCHALRELILDFRISRSYWVDIFRIYGSQLVSVYLIMPRVLDPQMKLLEETCPCLRRLTITSEFTFGPDLKDFVLPSVTYLGLDSKWHYPKSAEQKIDHFFGILEQFASRMPALRVVQILHEFPPVSLLNTHTKLALRALQSFETAPFRIEDGEGVLWTDRLRTLDRLRRSPGSRFLCFQELRSGNNRTRRDEAERQLASRVFGPTYWASHV